MKAHLLILSSTHLLDLLLLLLLLQVGNCIKWMLKLLFLLESLKKKYILNNLLGPYNTSDYPINIVVIPLIYIVVPLLPPYCYFCALYLRFHAIYLGIC